MEVLLPHVLYIKHCKTGTIIVPRTPYSRNPYVNIISRNKTIKTSSKQPGSRSITCILDDSHLRRQQVINCSHPALIVILIHSAGASFSFSFSPTPAVSHFSGGDTAILMFFPCTLLEKRSVPGLLWLFYNHRTSSPTNHIMYPNSSTSTVITVNQRVIECKYWTVFFCCCPKHQSMMVVSWLKWKQTPFSECGTVHQSRAYFLFPGVRLGFEIIRPRNHSDIRAFRFFLPHGWWTRKSMNLRADDGFPVRMKDALSTISTSSNRDMGSHTQRKLWIIWLVPEGDKN